MAVLLLESNNNFTSSNWKTVDATSYQGSEIQNATLSTSYTSSSTFTPGAITIEGILIKVLAKAVSPSGTMDVRLFNSTDSTQAALVTVNVSDIQSPGSNPITGGGGGGWHYFKLGSPLTLTAAKAYRIDLRTSVASQVAVYRDATTTNWSRGLVTSTTAAPGASDTLIIAGPITGAGASTVITCTHNNTASTAFGQMDIGANGKWILQNSASTAYRFDQANNSLILSTCNSVSEFGTSSARIVATSSMTFNLASSATTGNYLEVRSGSSFTMYGQDKTRFARAAADFSNGATSITTDVSTGWKNGDLIAIGATARAATPSVETKALTADASGTTLTITAVGTGKSGTAPVQAPLINLTSNAKMTGTSTTNTFAIRLSGAAPTMDFDNVQFDNMGGNATGSLRGISLAAGAGTGAMYVNINKCAFASGNASGVAGFETAQTTTYAGTILLTGNVGYTTAAMFNIVRSTATATLMKMNNNVAIGHNTFGFFLGMEQFECTGNIVNGCTGANAFSLSMIANTTTVDSNRVEVCGSNGFSLTLDRANITGLTAYRCNTFGITIAACKDSIIDGATLFGSTTANMVYAASVGIENTDFRNFTIDAGTTNTCPIGITTGANAIGRRFYMSNFLIGTNQTHSTSDFACNTIMGEFIFRNSTLASSTQVSSPTNMGSMTSVRIQRSGGTAGLHRSYWRSGRGDSDSTIVNTGTVRSLRLTPSSATLKLAHPLTIVNVKSGETVTISVRVRKSVVGDGAAYNGNEVRLLVRSNPAAGSSFNSEIVATSSTSAANGAWETLTYTTPAVTDDTALEFNVDCDGTTGWANVQVVRAS
jgi:hypothetical protein